MFKRRAFVAALPALLMASQGAAARTKTKTRIITSDDVERVVIFKSERKLFLLDDKKNTLKWYKVDLGFAPEGHKEQYGDGKTPEGHYRINRRNEHSRFHLSLGISYPDRDDIAAARKAGVNPGGNIFIHGRGPRFRFPKRDWTWGCIAVKDQEMEEIFALVKLGTLVSIYP